MARGPLRLDDLGGGEIRAADVAHLAGAHEVVERAQGFLDRRERVVPVHLIEVEPVGLEPRQARLDGRHDVAARGAFLFAVVHRHAEFRGQHDVLAAVAQHLTEHRLRAAAAAVNVGGIEQRDPGIERLVDDQAGAFEVHPLAEIVAAKPDQRDPQARLAQIAQNHVRSVFDKAVTLACASAGDNRAPAAAALALRQTFCYWIPASPGVPGEQETKVVHRPEGKGMLHPIRATARLIDQKIGWNRIGLALSLVIIVSAAVVLYRILRGISFSDVVVALKATDPVDVLLAGLFVAAGYFTLTFYDLFAVRTIGANHIPYRVAALAGFTSYSVGHNIGASVFTGGAVRYRVYSAWGLTAIDVAKICFIAGLTFWLGNVAVLGLGIAYEPQAASAIDQLPPWFNRVIALAGLALLAGYVAWVWVKPRVIGRADWVVTLPGGPLTLLQIAIGIVDLSCCALAMYVLMPDDPHIDFIKLAVIFVSATLLGFASHSPGGLGVFDAAMLVALIEFEKEQLLAGLLLFRLLYYVIPFALSLLILGVRELWLSVAAKT